MERPGLVGEAAAEQQRRDLPGLDHGGLGSGGNPPENASDDAPAGASAQYDGLVTAIFRLEDIELGIAAQARNAEAFLFVGNDDDFSVELGALGLRGIDSGDIAIVNQGLHGVATYAEQAGISGIGAPLGRRAHYIARGNVAQIAMAVTLTAMRANGGLQHGDGNDFGRARNFLFAAAASRRGQFHFFRANRKLLAIALGKHGQDVASLQSGTAPVKPAVRFAGKFAEFNVVTRGGGQLSVFPTRHGHSGTVQFPSQLSLRNAKLLAEVMDLLGPLSDGAVISFAFGHRSACTRGKMSGVCEQAALGREKRAWRRV